MDMDSVPTIPKVEERVSVGERPFNETLRRRHFSRDSSSLRSYSQNHVDFMRAVSLDKSAI